MVAPVLEGREGELRRELEALPAGAASPLAAVAGLHFARWVIVPQLVYGAEPQKADVLDRPLLVFTSTFDGSVGEHVDALLAGLGDAADDIWTHCDGWPGRSGAASWLLDQRQRTGLFVAAYPEATVDEVARSLDARERLLTLAEDLYGADASETRRRFLEEFA